MAIRYQSKLRQRGAATLLVSLLILVGATLIVMFSARTSLMEQRISGNEIRTKHASNAAQAGMDEALAYLTSGGRDETQIFSGNLADGSSYSTVFWGNNSPLTVANNSCRDDPGTPNGYINVRDPADPTAATIPPPRFIAGDPPVRVPFTIYSCGWSDDRAARQPMLITVQLQPPLPGNAPAPLIARGMVNTNGHGHVINYYTNLTIWSGKVLAVTGKAGTTFIRNTLTHPNIPTVSIAETFTKNQLPNNCDVSDDFACTTVGDRAGLDVLMDDFDLGTRTKDEFFEAFMGASKKEFEDDDLTVHRTQGELAGKTGEKIWVEGDVDLKGNIQIGSPTEPVILVVNGNLTVGGGFTFYGMLYVIKDLDSNGAPHFYGATVVEQNNDTGGTPKYIYDPYVLGRLNSLGPIGTVAGTWRNWLDR